MEALANSPIWNESVVFILEDDAQNGADHVDAHRSPVYIAGGFVKRGYIDHTPYSTASVLRTMELILGMEPMTQYDAAALPFWRCFDSLPKPSNFKAILPEIDLNEKNVVLFPDHGGRDLSFHSRKATKIESFSILINQYLIKFVGICVNDCMKYHCLFFIKPFKLVENYESSGDHFRYC